jgi:hypothetical protein
MEGSYEHGDESLCYIKVGKFLSSCTTGWFSGRVHSIFVTSFRYSGCCCFLSGYRLPREYPAFSFIADLCRFRKRLACIE